MRTQIEIAASGRFSTPAALATGVATAAFANTPGRTFYLELNGTGSVAGVVVWQCHDASYAPNVVAVNGAAPVLTDDIAYDGSVQNGVRLALSCDQATNVKFLPGTVAGSVTATFVE